MWFRAVNLGKFRTQFNNLRLRAMIWGSFSFTVYRSNTNGTCEDDCEFVR